MEMKQFLTGTVEIQLPKIDTSSKSEVDELLKLVMEDRENLTKAVDSLLKARGYKPSRIIHQNGRVFAEVSVGDSSMPKFGAVRKTRPNKSMSKGWSRGFVGFTSTLRETLSAWRKKGRKEMKFDELYKEVMDVFKDRQGKKFKAMDKDRFAMYLHDKRYFPTVKYNSLKKIVTF